jgi:hypothetical protein
LQGTTMCPGLGRGGSPAIASASAAACRVIDGLLAVLPDLGQTGGHEAERRLPDDAPQALNAGAERD